MTKTDIYNKKDGPVKGTPKNNGAILAMSNLVPWSRALILALGLLVMIRVERDIYTVLESHNQVFMNQVLRQDHINTQLEDLLQHQAALQMHQNEFAACLVLQTEQELPYVTEWLAYHYHVLPLRRVIVWKDPLLEASPTPILNRWKDRMQITLWDNEDQIYPASHPYHKNKNKNNQHKKSQEHHAHDANSQRTLPIANSRKKKNHHDIIQERNARQDIFFGACLRQMKREGQSWTILSHTDEYTLINPRIRQSNDPLHQATLVQKASETGANKNSSLASFTTTTTQLEVPTMQDPGSVLTWIQRTQPYANTIPQAPDVLSSPSSSNSNNNGYILSQPCIPLTSRQFGTKERDDIQEGERFHVLSSNQSLPTDVLWENEEEEAETKSKKHENKLLRWKDFLTLRWQYWGHAEHATNVPMVRKSMVDLSRIPASLLHWKVASHRPIPHSDVCPSQSIHEHANMFVLHHYSGTMERVKFDHQKNNEDPAAKQPKGKGKDKGAAVSSETAADYSKGLVPNLDQEERLHRDVIHNTYHETTIPEWLEGFVATVGITEAQRLLQGVGHAE